MDLPWPLIQLNSRDPPLDLIIITKMPTTSRSGTLAEEEQNAAKYITGITNLKGEPGGGQRGFAETEFS